MRQFFKLMAVVALALLVATPAMALDFKFGAEYRVRFYDMVNMGFNDGPNTNPGGVQVRVRPRFDVSDDNGNMTATLRLEIGDVEWGNGGGAAGTTNGGTNGSNNSSGARVGNGTGGALGADGVNVETKWAYVDFASPWGVPLRWRAGIQPWYLPKGIIMDDDAAGLRAYGTYSMLSYDFGWYRASAGLQNNQACAAAVTGGPCSNIALTNTQNQGPVFASPAASGNQNQDNALDYYQAKMDLAIAKWLNPGLYYIYGRNAATGTGTGAAIVNNTVASQQFLGLTVTGDAGFLKYDFDWMYGQQNGGMTGNQFQAANWRQNVQGWMIDAGVHIPVGPVLIHVVGSYATGDKQNGGKSEAMPWISPSWNGAGGLYELIGSGGNYDATETSQDYPAGLWMIGTGVEYRPVKALWLRLMYGFAGFTEVSANCAFNKNTQAAGSVCYGPSYQGTGYRQTTTSGPAQGIGGLAGKAQFGQEISLRADYDLWTNFKIQTAAGWLIPTGGSTVSEYVLQLYYNF
jgi:hypothetical protein